MSSIYRYNINSINTMIVYFSGIPCNDAYSFCGLRDQKYPDTRAMGYPFDRNSKISGGAEIDSLATLTRNLPNATLGECSIRFTNTLINRS